MTIVSILTAALFLFVMDRKALGHQKTRSTKWIIWSLYAVSIGLAYRNDMGYPLYNPSDLIKTGFQPISKALELILQ